MSHAHWAPPTALLAPVLRQELRTQKWVDSCPRRLYDRPSRQIRQEQKLPDHYCKWLSSVRRIKADLLLPVLIWNLIRASRDLEEASCVHFLVFWSLEPESCLCFLTPGDCRNLWSWARNPAILAGTQPSFTFFAFPFPCSWLLSLWLCTPVLLSSPMWSQLCFWQQPHLQRAQRSGANLLPWQRRRSSWTSTCKQTLDLLWGPSAFTPCWGAGWSRKLGETTRREK